MKNYIEPRLRRDFGGIIAAYFDFLKLNVKSILNTFITYNGIYVIFLLISSYLIVTGAIQAAVATSNYQYGTNYDGSMLLGFGVILLLIILLIATLINYGISSAYVSLYEQQKQNNLSRKSVWTQVKSKLGGLLLVALSAVVLYVAFVIVQLVLAFIPILGSIASMIIAMGFNAWISLTVFSYMHHKDQGVFQSFGEAWELLFSGFWKSIGVNFVLGLIIQIAMMSMTLLPSILVGIFVFHTIDDGTTLDQSIFGQLLIVVMVTIFCLIILFIQFLSQSINAFLYFNLHEFKHNTYLRSRIDQLGTAS